MPKQRRIYLFLTPDGHWWAEDKAIWAIWPTGFSAPTKAERVVQHIKEFHPDTEVTVDILSALDERVK